MGTGISLQLHYNSKHNPYWNRSDHGSQRILQIARPVVVRVPFQVRRRLLHTMGDAASAWFGQHPSGGRVIQYNTQIKIVLELFFSTNYTAPSSIIVSHCRHSTHFIAAASDDGARTLTSSTSSSTASVRTYVRLFVCFVNHSFVYSFLRSFILSFVR